MTISPDGVLFYAQARTQSAIPRTWKFAVKAAYRPRVSSGESVPLLVFEYEIKIEGSVFRILSVYDRAENNAFVCKNVVFP